MPSYHLPFHSPTPANGSFANMLLFHSLTLQRHWGLMTQIASLGFGGFFPFLDNLHILFLERKFFSNYFAAELGFVTSCTPSMKTRDNFANFLLQLSFGQ